MRVKHILISYALLGIVTFAWAASDPHAEQCGNPEWVANDFARENACSSLGKGFRGMWAGLLWPLYWSWTVAEELR